MSYPTNPGKVPENLFFENRVVWSVEDVARELQVSIRHVYKLVSQNRIPYCKVGRLVRFCPVRICEWLHKGGTR